MEFLEEFAKTNDFQKKAATNNKSMPQQVNTHENSETDLRLQAQEHMYRQTLAREKNKVSLHALEEVGRSITAISQRRRQYFLDYKSCSSIRQIRQWFAWETKRNIDTNQAIDAKPENAATRGLKSFLNKVEFYGTLLTRFGEYAINVLTEHYMVERAEKYEVGKTKEKMLLLQEKCTTLLSDNHEVELKSANYTEVEIKFPVISILRQVHDTLCQMVDLATIWRIHARYAARYESVNHRRSRLASIEQLDEKMEVIKNLESRIRLSKYDISEVERELREREAAMASTEFCDVYNKCTDRIEELSGLADEMKLEIKSLDTTIKYLHEKTETFKKMVQHKRKEKLEFNLLNREEKLKELNGILAEISRLEEHKKMLDLKEEMWLRGGFEQELGMLQDLKNKLDKLKKGVDDLQEQKNEEKESYHQTRERVLELDTEYEVLDREYEYVKRLSATMVPILWKTSAFQQLPINSVKPNRISNEKEQSEETYVLTQPKGVAMIISNDESPIARASPKPLSLENNNPSPHPVSRETSFAPFGTQAPHVPSAISCMAAVCAQLGFYIMPRHQLSSEALDYNIASMSEQYHDFACNLNSIMIILSARSDEYGRPLGAEETKTPVSITQYLKHFTQEKCPSVAGKPKIFLFMLRVTERDPKAPVIGQQSDQGKKKNSVFSSTSVSSSGYFQPERIDLSEFGDDILVIRIMYQPAGGVEAAPTYGGVSSSNRSRLPWHIQVLIGTMMEQACYKDFLSLLEYVKEEVTLGPKARVSPSAKIEGEPDEVEIFIDHSLRKKLYLMPGI